MGQASDRRTGTLVAGVAGALIALVLLAVVLTVASPAEVWRLIRLTEKTPLAIAFGVSAGFLAARGLRLLLLMGSPDLGWLRATLVAAAAQGAALFAPLRTGDQPRV